MKSEHCLDAAIICDMCEIPEIKDDGLLYVMQTQSYTDFIRYTVELSKTWIPRNMFVVKAEPQYWFIAMFSKNKKYYYKQQFDEIIYKKGAGMVFGGIKHSTTNEDARGVYSGKSYDASQMIGKNIRSVREEYMETMIKIVDSVMRPYCPKCGFQGEFVNEKVDGNRKLVLHMCACGLEPVYYPYKVHSCVPSIKVLIGEYNEDYKRECLGNHTDITQD